jgi:hypothetical protein
MGDNKPLDTHRSRLSWRDITLIAGSPFRTIEVLTNGGQTLSVVLYRMGCPVITVAGPALSDIDVLLLALDIKRRDRNVGTLHHDDSVMTDALRSALIAAMQVAA